MHPQNLSKEERIRLLQKWAEGHKAHWPISRRPSYIDGANRPYNARDEEFEPGLWFVAVLTETDSDVFWSCSFYKKFGAYEYARIETGLTEEQLRRLEEIYIDRIAGAKNRV